MGTSLKVAPVSGIMGKCISVLINECYSVLNNKTYMPIYIIGHIPHRVPQIVINKTPIRHMEFDVQLLGDCDVIVPELCRRLGWELKHEKLPNGTSHGEPGDEPFEFVPPNFYLFRGAVLEEEIEEPDTEPPLNDIRSDHELLLDGLPSDVEEEEEEIHGMSLSIANAVKTTETTTTETAIALNYSSSSTSLG
jgi:hypothetical protein